MYALLSVVADAFCPSSLDTSHFSSRHSFAKKAYESVKIESHLCTTSRSTTEKSLATPLSTTSSNTQKWYPTRIQEDVDYKRVVQSLYLRHIVVETKEVAKVVLNQYSQTTTGADPFGELAAIVSACAESREEAGKIGWVDLLQEEEQLQHPLLPASVVKQLVPLSPKMGDVYVLEAVETNQVHLVKVEELLLRSNFWTPSVEPSTMESRIGAHTGQNAIITRSKLKGQGVIAKTASEPETYLLQTNGCQMNVADSERLQGILEGDLNLRQVQNGKEADLVVINTCSIRDHAEQKLYDILGPYRIRKRQGEAITLVVTGCVAQQEGQALLQKIPELDVVLGPQYVPHLKTILEQLQWSGSNQLVVTAPMLHQESTSDTELLSKPIRGHPIKGFVNTILGCNEHCTYCVVPATRGMEQSRPMESILAEIVELLQDGYKEITLLGQNIDAYGRDMVPRRSFAQLLEYLDQNTADYNYRIRYTTSHPRYMSDRAIDAIAHLPKVCEGYHVPFQAGDNQVLKDMRRGYSYESYLKIIERIRRESPDAGIFADVIVGFPGETEEQFQRTLDLMNAVHFDNLNAFMYSTRPNTEAAGWENQIPEDIKRDRLHRVQALATEHGLERSKRYLGKAVEVLVEDPNPRNPNQVMGRTRQGRQVYFDGKIDSLQGEFVMVEVTEARTWSLMGRMVNDTEP